jgi:glyoxylase I family protein
MHHVSLLVNDTGRALKFYCDILGMQPVPRPDLGFPGAWLGVGPQQIHLLELPDPDADRSAPEHPGRDRHVALIVTNIEVLEQRLQRTGTPFNRSGSGRKALFCRDPDGNGLEFIESGQV